MAKKTEIKKAAPKKAASAKKASPEKKASPKAKAVAEKKAAAKSKAAPKKKAAAKSGTVIDTVYNAVNRSKSGISIDDLKKKTKIEGRQLSNALYKLTKRGKIKSKSRGVYIT